MTYTPKDNVDAKRSVRVATTAALAANSRSGNVITASANGALAAIDGVSLAVGNRMLVKNEATGANNGIYFVTSLGSAGTPFVLTRSHDADGSSELNSGAIIPVEEGTVNGDSVWILATNETVSINTTSLLFSRVGGYGSSPVGVISDFAGASAPSGWLICDGLPVSRSTYSELFAVINTTFGAGDGLTTFNTPDLRGRVGVGLDDMGGSDAGRLSVANTLGGSGGLDAVILVASNLPGHTHNAGTLLGPSHSHAAGSLTIPAHSHDNGSYNMPSHSHGPGSLLTASHNHGPGTLSTSIDTTGGPSATASIQRAAGTSAFTIPTVLHSHSIPALPVNQGQTALGGSTSLTGVTANVAATPIFGSSGTQAATLVTGSTGADGTGSVTGSTGNVVTAGGAAAASHDNMQPYLLLNKIIYAGV